MARGNPLQKIETFLIVTVISILIWLYAEGQNVRSFNRELVRVQFVSPPNQNLAFEPRTAQKVYVNFLASNRQKMRLDALLDKGPVQLPITDATNGQTLRNLTTVNLLQESVFGELGIGIESADPSELPITVESIEDVELQVKVATGELELADTPITDPKRVTAHLTQRLAELAQGGAVVAELTERHTENADEGVPDTRRIELKLAPELLEQANEFDLQHIDIEPAMVNVTYTLQSQTRTTTLARVPVYLSVPPTLVQKFDISVDESQRFLSDIQLSGPLQELQQIESEQVRIRAEISPTAQQLQDGDGSVQPRLVGLPPRVTHSPLPPVRITVQPREE